MQSVQFKFNFFGCQRADGIRPYAPFYTVPQILHTKSQDGPILALFRIFLLAVCQRGYSLKAFEQIDKMAGVQIPQLRRDLGDALTGLAQLAFGNLNLPAVDVACKALSCLPAEQTGKIAGA